jgi:hypothetical protein
VWWIGDTLTSTTTAYIQWSLSSTAVPVLSVEMRWKYLSLTPHNRLNSDYSVAPNFLSEQRQSIRFFRSSIRRREDSESRTQHHVYVIKLDSFLKRTRTAQGTECMRRLSLSLLFMWALVVFLLPLFCLSAAVQNFQNRLNSVLRVSKSVSSLAAACTATLHDLCCFSCTGTEGRREKGKWENW